MSGATWTMPREVLTAGEKRREKVDLAVRQGIVAGLIRVVTKLKTKFLNGDPIHRRTGNLSRSVFSQPTSVDGFQSSPYVGVVGIGREAPYAYGLNEGNPPHIITARGETISRAGASGLDVSGLEGHPSVLHFFRGGEEYFRREVHHPGNPPFKFMEGALAETKEEFFADMQRRANQALAETI